MVFRMDNLSVGIPRSSARWQRAETYPQLSLPSGTKPPRQSAEPGRDQLERPVAITWNRWSRSAGISGRDQLDSVVAIAWNTQSDPEPRNVRFDQDPCGR
jgi:hypothetical protein